MNRTEKELMKLFFCSDRFGAAETVIWTYPTKNMIINPVPAAKFTNRLYFFLRSVL